MTPAEEKDLEIGSLRLHLIACEDALMKWEMSPLTDIRGEFLHASYKYPSFNSAHEGYAVLLEEVDELWDEVKVRQDKHDLVKMRKEAVQVAAMALRFIVDICDGGRGQK